MRQPGAMEAYGPTFPGWQATLDAVALKLNTRPRQTLGFSTPGAKLAERVALTG